MNMKCFALSRGLCSALACALVFVAAPGLGQEVASAQVVAPVSSAVPGVVSDDAYAPANLLARYPAQSITSLEQANNAVVDVKKGKQRIEGVFKAEEKACYKTFFANRCITEAKKRRHRALAEIRPIELEAQRFKRHDTVSKRDAALEAKRLKDAGVGSDRTPEQKRADNEAAFEKKQQDREAAQQQVREKRARTERRRQKKAAQAAKRAKAVKANAPSASSGAASASPTSAPTSTSPGASSGK